MAEEYTPAGLGSKLYVCPVEEFKKNSNAPMQEVKPLEGIRIDLSKEPEREYSNDTTEKGWTITATGRLDNPNASKTLRKMLFGDGRLPRKEKKRCINKVLCNRKALMFVSALMYNDSVHVLSVLASLMFPEKIRKTTEKGTYIVLPTPAQQRAAFLCMKRIPKQAVRLFRKHRKELEEDLHRLETLKHES